MQTEATTTATAIGTADATELPDVTAVRSPKAEVLRSWAEEAPGPLAVAMRRRACELDLLAAAGAALATAA